jgi:hypothetical protein
MEMDSGRRNVESRWRKILILILLLASTVEFWVRGPSRMFRASEWNDLLSPYIQAKAWAHGGDPYNAQTLVAQWPADDPRPVWVDRDAAQGMLEKKRGIPTPYPLTSLVLLSPLTLLRWTLAMRLWIVLSIGAALGAGLGLIFICDASLSEPRSQIFLAAVLALAPLHTGLATANPAILSAGLGVFAVAAARCERTALAGVLLAAAVCLKPTLGAGLLVYYLAREWRVVAIAGGLAGFMELIGIWRCAEAGLPWLASYIANTHRIFARGSLADFTRTDPVGFNLVNGQLFFSNLLHSAEAANLLSWLLCFTLALCWIYLARRRGSSEILPISAISILTLIPIYHRFYDAVLLIWPLAWSMFLVRNRRVQAATLIMIAPFLVPGAVFLATLTQAGRIPTALSSQWWWTTLVLSHEAWDLILLSVVLLCFLAVENRQPSPQPKLAAACSSERRTKSGRT